MNRGDVTSVFVYGTLQQGEERAACWPHAPQSITPGEIRAALYDLGEYPAIIDGDDRVAGELWQIAPQHLDATLQALDAIECCGQDGVDLYVRRVVECRTAHGPIAAFTYFLADEAIARTYPRVLPGADRLCRWHRFR